MRCVSSVGAGLMPVMAVGVFASDGRAGEVAADAKAVVVDSGVGNGLCIAIGLDPPSAKALAAESRLFVQLAAPDDS